MKTLRLILITFWVCCVFDSNAKEILIDSAFQNINLADDCDFAYINKNDDLDAEFIANIEWRKHENNAVLFNYQKKAYLFRVIANNHSSIDEVIISCEQPNIDHFEITSARVQRSKLTGDLYNWDTREFEESYPTFSWPLANNVRDTLYIKVYMAEDGVAPLMMYQRSEYIHYFIQREWLFGIFIGLMSVIGLYNLFLYFSVAHRVYLVYSIYVIFIAATQVSLFGNGLGHFYGLSVFLSKFDGILFPCILGPVAILLVITFFKFSNHLKIWKIFKLCSIPFISAGIISVVIPSTLQECFQIINISFIISYILLVIVITQSYRHNNQLSLIFSLAWNVLLLGSFFYALINFGVLKPTKLLLSLMPIGVCLETIIMSFAVGYRIKILEKEKETSKQQLVASKLASDRLEIENREAQLQTLRSQLNPHFIFNALNSAQNFVVDNKSEKASKFIADFAQLMRQSLLLTEVKTIPLKAEVAFIEEYLSVERVRFNENFDFKVDVDPNLDQDEIQVPPLLTQPFIENSIKHAFVGLEHGNIEVRVTEPKVGILNIDLEDDGIGLQRKVVKTDDHNSKGISISTKRIKLLNKKRQQDISFTITDKKEYGSNTGVIVNLLIPM